MIIDIIHISLLYLPDIILDNDMIYLNISIHRLHTKVSWSDISQYQKLSEVFALSSEIRPQRYGCG